jgi:hypothetical protein
MSRHEAALRDLKTFQRATVDYVERRMFDEGQRRFLVADEVGLGKTLVARGIVARAIERLEDRGVKRIDIVYICSNAEIARQNIRKLNVLEGGAFERAERITLLPLYVHDLKATGRRVKHNFVSFTPGTMPDPGRGHRTGWARERALLYRLLAEAWGFRARKGPKRVLQGTTRTLANFEWEIRQVDRMRVDPGLRRSFVAQLRREEKQHRLRARFEELAAVLSRREPRSDENERRNALVGELRWHLARVCVEALEPDLIILDEFQRFRDLLDSNSEVAELAQSMFTSKDAHVLLLSATPYRMFTSSDDGDDDHHRDFARTIRFLFGDDARAAEVDELLEGLRIEVLRPDGSPQAIAGLRGKIEERLRLVMTRTERLAADVTRVGMLDPSAGVAPRLEADDLDGYVSFRRALRDLGDDRASTLLEYWKSAPYLVNVMDGYQQKRLLEQAASTPGRGRALARRLHGSPGVLPFTRVRSYRSLPAANARMRNLIAETVDNGAARRLWLAPTLRYYELRAPFDGPPGTKRLVFSSWAVVPKAIAAVVSYDAEQRVVCPKGRAPESYNASPRKLDRRLLDFKRASGTGRSTGMPVLGLVYPSFALALVADPLELRRERALIGGELPTYDDAVKWASARVAEQIGALPATAGDRVDKRWYWAAPILLDAERDRDATIAWLDRAGLADIWSEGKGDSDATTRASSWAGHVALAAQLARGELELGRMPDDLPDVLAELALAGPGVATLRALSRVVPLEYADPELRDAAAGGAWAFRTLLNHPESIALIRSLIRRGPYWRRALRYCGLGGIQAMLDEYVHVTHDIRGIGREESAAAAAWELSRLLRIAAGLKTAAVVADEVDPDREQPFVPFTFRARFAARYGESREVAGEERTRAESLRDAFNSPFWPFVLATTSVGQEGLDFHAYCHSVSHWNLPSNPVDLEQREGRVHRYKGHAVRKNIAADHGDASFAQNGRDPWESLFARAVEATKADASGDLVPFWVYEGDAKIERHVPMLPLSRDAERYRRLQRSLGLYRMVLGQPRQEDLVELLAHRGEDATAIQAELRVDLSPPRSHRKATGLLLRTAG